MIKTKRQSGFRLSDAGSWQIVVVNFANLVTESAGGLEPNVAQ